MKRSDVATSPLPVAQAFPGDLVQSAVALAAAPPSAPRPGHCTLHPAQALVSHRAANLRRWGEDPRTICVMCLADDRVGERCTWCGGPLFPPETRPWQVSDRRAFCSPLHRLQAHRARTKGSLA